MKTKSAKAKGRRLAMEIRELLLKAALGGLDDADIGITPSGVTGDDLFFSPKGREYYPFSVECKNQERLNIWEAIDQVNKRARPDSIPVVFFRKNHQRPYIAMDAEIFIQLFRKRL